MRRALVLASTTAIVLASCSSVASGVSPSMETGAPTVAAPSPAAAVPAASAASGCTLPALPFDANDANDDGGTYSGRTAAVEPPVLSSGTQVASVSDSALAAAGLSLPTYAPMGLPVAAIVSHTGRTVGTESDPSEVRVYYAKGSIGTKDTFLDILSRPGADLAVSQTQGNDAQRVVDTIGQAATVIEVGPYRAAITHSSTFPNGMRIYGIFWSDGTLDFSVGVNGSAAEAIKTARSMYCK